jgi:hypothetical protein
MVMPSFPPSWESFFLEIFCSSGEYSCSAKKKTNSDHAFSYMNSAV